MSSFSNPNEFIMRLPGKGMWERGTCVGVGVGL